MKARLKDGDHTLLSSVGCVAFSPQRGLPPVPVIKGQAWIQNLRRKQGANDLILMGGAFSNTAPLGFGRLFKEALIQVSGRLEEELEGRTQGLGAELHS